MARRKGTYALAVLLIFAALGAARPAAAVPITLIDGVWAVFSWAGLGPIDAPADGYVANVPAGFAGRLRVVDCCLVGDRFQVFSDIDGFLFETSPFLLADDGVQTSAVTGDVAWADARLSKGQVFLFGLGHDIDINVTDLALGAPSGSAFVRLDLEPVVPEPATVTLLGIGLAALGLRNRRRRA